MGSLSPKLKLTLMADGDNVAAGIVTNNSAIMDTVSPVTPYTPLNATDPPPGGAPPYDGHLYYNTLAQTLRRYNASENAYQTLAFSDKYFGGTQRPRMVARATDTASRLIAGGSGIQRVNWNGLNFTTPGTGSLSTVGVNDFVFVDQGWFWWTGTPYPPTSKVYQAQIYVNAAIGGPPPNTMSTNVNAGQIAPAGNSISVPIDTLLAYSVEGYNSDKMGCKVSYILTGNLQVFPMAAGNVTVYVDSFFQTDAGQFPNTTSAGRSADANGSATLTVYQVN